MLCCVVLWYDVLCCYIVCVVLWYEVCCVVLCCCGMMCFVVLGMMCCVVVWCGMVWCGVVCLMCCVVVPVVLYYGVSTTLVLPVEFTVRYYRILSNPTILHVYNHLFLVDSFAHPNQPSFVDVLSSFL